MDYFEKHRQLILSPIMYREKDTFYLFTRCDRKKYVVNSKAICEQWENDFRKLLMLLRQLDMGVSEINRDDFFTMETITLIAEINNWLEWLLNVDYTIPEQEKNKIYTFDVKAGTGKTFYTIAKVCDRANSVEKITDGYRVTFKGNSLTEIELMYFLRSGWDWNIYGKKEGVIASYLIKYSRLYRMIISSRDVLKQIETSYGYYTVPEAIKEKVFYAIQKKSKEFQKKANELYNEMLLENRVKAKWTNEYHLFELIKRYNYKAQYQYRCDWLGQQSLDIYIPESRIGIEYQGEQHYKAVDIWGGEVGLRKNKKRDLQKKKICAENKVILLEWSYQIPVNNENVLRFMKDNKIPFLKNEKDIQIREEMAPIILPKKKIKEEKTKIKNIKYYIIQYDLEGYYVNKYADIGSAARAVGVSATSISKVLRGQRSSAAGFVWRKVGANEKITKHIVIGFDIKKINTGKAKRIAQLNVHGQVVGEFGSIAEAAKKTNISIKHIEKELRKQTSMEWRICD